jgi:hypothetical protein
MSTPFVRVSIADMSTTRARMLNKVDMSTNEPNAPLKLGATVTGQSGKQYQIAQMLQYRTKPVLSVFT